jgi:hypothetical protein
MKRIWMLAMVGAIGAALFTQVPEIRRYLKVRSMD